MHVLFDSDNYNTLRQDIFKKVKATIDSTELDTDNKLQKQKIILSDGSLKYLNIPVDTGHKLNVHETFRRCPGRLLNVLYTFSLRPVSAGIYFVNT